MITAGRTSIHVRARVAKYGIERVVDISDWIVDVLLKYVRSEGRFSNGYAPVLVNSLGRLCTPRVLRQWMGNIRVRCELEDYVNVHSMRHTFASALIFYKSSLTEVQLLMGHRRITTTEIYVHTPFRRKKLDMKVFEKFYRAAQPSFMLV